MQQTIKLSPIALSIAAAISLSACSSSNNSATDDTTEGTATGTATFSLEQDRAAILDAMAGFAIESQTENVMLLADTISAAGLSSVELAAGSIVVLGRAGENVEIPTTRTQFDCALGGTVVTETAMGDLNDVEYTNLTTHLQYEFDQCRIETNGEQLMTGTVRSFDRREATARSNQDSRTVQWSDLDWQIDSKNYLKGTALIVASRLDTGDESEYRTATIDRFESYNGDQLQMKIADSYLAVSKGNEGSGIVDWSSFAADGTATNAAGVDVVVSTPEPLMARLVSTEEFSSSAEPYTGSLEFSAADNSSLTLTANPIALKGPFLVDVNYVSASGEVNLQTGVEFVPPAIFLAE